MATKIESLRIVVCDRLKDVAVRKAVDFAMFCANYGDDRVTRYRDHIVIDGSLTQMTISYKSLHSHNYDAIQADEFELDSSAAMHGSLKDIDRVLSILRAGHIGISHEVQ